MGALSVLALAAISAVGSPTVGARIAASAVAAQSQQGPLDGTWTLSDMASRTLLIFQIVDTVSRVDDLQAAWREPGVDGDLGVAARALRRGDHLTSNFGTRGAERSLSLRRRSSRVWRGTLRQNGRIQTVILRRG